MVNDPNDPNKPKSGLPSEDTLPSVGGDSIGPYRILGILGQGGMGTVYRAEQIAPVKREVALKVVRFGMDSEHFLARFQVERQALASLNHPNIAVVHDAGTTRHAMPYFVMELLKGEPIDEYCDSHRLSIDDRLKVFLDVCRGMHHAHQKGIIHRDIKPSNVMVTEDDAGNPVPKIIDFGMAKQLEDQETKVHLTEFGWTVGTPLFMCPEQVEGAVADIDIRSDVYSLGVLLYMLLVGDYPFDLNNVSRARIFHVIVNEVAPPPSVRLAELDNIDELADKRGTQVSTFRKRLRGELDWVIMRALEKDRDQRYQSVNQFVEDIERYLAHEPVLAGPPSRRYRLRKFIKRNKMLATTSLLFLLTLVAGVIGTSTGMVRAIKAKNAAEVSESKANATVDYLRRVLASADPYKDGRKMKVAELLENASLAVSQDLADQPEIAASIRQTIGWTFLELGMYDQAQEQLSQALLFQDMLLGKQHHTTLETRNALGRVYYKQGKYDASEKIHRSVLVDQKALHGARDPRTQWTLYNLAKVLDRLGQLQEAESLYRENLKVRQEILGLEHPHTLVSTNSLSLFLSRIGRHDEAVALQRDGWQKLQRILGPDHPNTLNSESNLAVILFGMKEWEQSLEIIEDTLQRQQVTLGEHPETFISAELKAKTLLKLGRVQESVDLHQSNLAARTRLLGEDHPHVVRSEAYLAESLSANGQIEAAEKLLIACEKKAIRTLDLGHHETTLIQLIYAEFLLDQERYDEARVMFKSVLAHAETLEHEERMKAQEVGSKIIEQTGQISKPQK